MNSKLLKLAKLVMKFAEIETDKGILTISDELAVGVEVYKEVEGEFVPVEDGAYETDTQVITIKDGKVEAIEDKEVEAPIEEEPVREEMEEEAPVEEDAQPDERDAKIAELENKITELEGLLQDRDAVIAELTAKLKEVEDKAQAPVEKPLEMSACVREMSNKENGALKFFS